ncbi:hypothetical protein, partial [Escherichia coli]|uniref:hypothetical protein n=1 Tax=Escherichia coli TaxID=562 RepID=UPI001BC8A285
ARNGGKNSLNRLIRCVCGKKIGPDPRNFNQRVSLGRNDLLIRTFLSTCEFIHKKPLSFEPPHIFLYFPPNLARVVRLLLYPPKPPDFSTPVTQ